MPTDDYIKRSDVLQIECDLCAATHCKRDYKCIKAIRLNNLPAADVEPVMHGRWIPINRINPAWGQFGIAQHKCSVCGSEEVIARKRCPECGAKMGKDEEDGVL